LTIIPTRKGLLGVRISSFNTGEGVRLEIIGVVGLVDQVGSGSVFWCHVLRRTPLAEIWLPNGFVGPRPLRLKSGEEQALIRGQVEDTWRKSGVQLLLFIPRGQRRAAGACRQLWPKGRRSHSRSHHFRALCVSVGTLRAHAATQ